MKNSAGAVQLTMKESVGTDNENKEVLELSKGKCLS